MTMVMDPQTQFAVIVPRRELLTALRLPAKLAGGGTSLPVLRCLLLRCAEGRLRLSATNLEQEAQTSCEATGSGSACVPAKAFLDRISALPEGDVQLTLLGDRLSVKCGQTHYQLAPQPAEDFPGEWEVKGETWEVPGHVLTAMLRAVSPAVSTDDTRPILTGVKLSCTDGRLVVVATDTHTLNEAQATVAAPDGGWLLPANAARLLCEGLDDERTWQVQADASQFRCTDGTTTLTSRLISENPFPFPPYQRVIPTESTTVWEVFCPDLGVALKRTRLVAADAATKGRVQLQHRAAEAQEIHLFAESDEGVAEDQVTASVTGEPLPALAVDGGYLTRALDAFAGLGVSEVRLGLTAPLSPILITAVTPGDITLRCVVMPMQIR